MSEKKNRMSLPVEDNKLKGAAQDGEVTKRSVYRVMDKDTGIYNRVHFETSSNMIWDATYNSRGNMIAKRDASGNIEFNDIIAENNLNVKGQIVEDTTFSDSVTISNTLKVNKGAEILESLKVTGASAVVDKNVSVGEQLDVTGLSTFNSNIVANADINLTTGNLNIKNSEIRSGGTLSKSLVISAEDETLYLRASKTNSASSGEVRINRNNVEVNKPLSVTGGIDVTLDVAGANIIAKNGQLRTTKNNLLTTLGSDTSATFDISTAASLVKINKPTTIAGNIVASGGNITADGTLNITNFTIERKLIEGATTPGLYSSDSSIYVNKPLRMPSGTAVSTNFNADKVDGCDVNDSVVSTANLWTSNKINSQKADKSIRIIADTSNNITGGGTLDGNITISHGKPGSVVTTLGVPKASYMMIRRVGLDTNGHVATVETEDMSKVFASTADLDERLANSNETVNGQFIKHSNIDAQGAATPARNTVNNLYMKNYSIDYNAQKSCIEFTFV